MTMRTSILHGRGLGLIGLPCLLVLALACAKDKATTAGPEDEFELPPEREVPKTASKDADEKTKKGAKKKDEKTAKQVTPPKVVVPQDRDQNLEKAKMTK